VERLVVSVESRNDGSIAVVLEGELDLDVCDSLERALEALSTETGEHLVLDLRALRFMDSTGLRAIVSMARRVERQGGSLRLIQGPAQVRRVFELTGMDRSMGFVAADGMVLSRPGGEAPAPPGPLGPSGLIAS
jgi:anti-sigma B factor antagonist